MSATIVDALPEGERWLYEVKLDGYRALIVKDGERVRLVSRNEKDLTAAYPSATTAAKRLNADSAVVDGEIVAVDAQGRPSFQALQHRGAHPRRHLSVCRPAEQQSLPLGRGRHRGADDRDAVGETEGPGADSVRRMDGRRPPAPRGFSRPARRQARQVGHT
jgi:hypothetical protein